MLHHANTQQINLGFGRKRKLWTFGLDLMMMPSVRFFSASLVNEFKPYICQVLELD